MLSAAQAETPMGLQTNMPPERGERPAKAERGRPVGHDHLSLIWSLFTLPLRGPQMNIYEVQQGNLSENWFLHPPSTHTQHCLLQTLLLECLRIWFLTAQIQLSTVTIEPCGTALTVPRIVSGVCHDNEKAFPNETLNAGRPFWKTKLLVFKGVYIFETDKNESV